MDIATLIGILVSFTLVIVSILVGGDGSWFLNTPSLMIVGGGTMGATLLAYPLKEVLSVFKVAKNVFMHKSAAVSELIQRYNLLSVVDPVMIAKGGTPLLKQEAVEAVRRQLPPRTLRPSIV